MKLHLKRFDMSGIADDKTIVLVGKRDTGKSVLVKDILYHHSDIPLGTVISESEHVNPFYSDIVPDCFIYNKFDPKVVTNVLNRQDMVKQHMKRETETYGSTKMDPRCFLIMDDCLASGKSWKHDENIRTVFLNGRHYKMLYILTMQYPLGIPPDLRCNIDYVFILRENLMNNRRRIYENFASMFTTFELFCDVLNQTTENYECLVIHNNAKSNRLEDQVFWYKAEQHPPFRMCDRKYWDLSEKIRRQREEDQGDADGGDMFDPSALRPKRTSPYIAVKKR